MVYMICIKLLFFAMQYKKCSVEFCECCLSFLSNVIFAMFHEHLLVQFCWTLLQIKCPNVVLYLSTKNNKQRFNSNLYNLVLFLAIKLLLHEIAVLLLLMS